MKKSDYNDVKSSMRLCMQTIEDVSEIQTALTSLDEEQLPTWWTNKLAVSSAYLNSLRDYIVYSDKEEDEQVESEDEQSESEDEQSESEDEYVQPEESTNLTLGSYTTQHFDICPSAYNLYYGIADKTNMIHLVQESAMLHDIFFKLEKQAIAMGIINKEDLDKSIHYANMIINLARQMGLESEHSYITEIHLSKLYELLAQEIDYSMIPPSARRS
jgi:hypothetical protein